MTLGLGLISLMVGTMVNLLHASRASAEATETIERGYFLMDAMGNWVAETSPLPPTMLFKQLAEARRADRLPSENIEIDACQAPDAAPLPPKIAGIVILEPDKWPSIPPSNLELSAPALLLEQRVLCEGDCYEDGFYVVPRHCHEGGGMEARMLETGGLDDYHIVWINAGSDRSSCIANKTVYQINRSLVYIRDYSWRPGDGVRAVMIRELAREPEPRWLRSSMLSHGIDGWQVDCLSSCFEVVGGAGALFAAAINLNFVVDAHAQSISIQRVLAP